jgi:hypothetical protein
MTRTDKKDFSLQGKSHKKHTSLKNNISHLICNNKRVWVNSAVFQKYGSGTREKNRKISLLVDSATSYRGFIQCRVMFFLPYTASVWHPMEMGINKSIMDYFRQYLVLRFTN